MLFTLRLLIQKFMNVPQIYYYTLKLYASKLLVLLNMIFLINAFLQKYL